MLLYSSFTCPQVNIGTCLFRHFGPQKEKFSLGVTTLKLLPSGNLLLGTGDGRVAELSTPPKGLYSLSLSLSLTASISLTDTGDRKQQSKAVFKKLRSTKIPGAVTSVALRGRGSQFFVGTARGQVYQVNFEDFSSTLVGSCHYDEVTDIVFPL